MERGTFISHYLFFVVTFFWFKLMALNLKV